MLFTSIPKQIEKQFGLPTYQQMLFILWTGISSTAFFSLYNLGIFNHEYLGTGISALVSSVVSILFGAVILISFISPKQAHSLLFTLPILLCINIIQYLGNKQNPYTPSLDILILTAIITFWSVFVWATIIFLERVLHVT